MEMGSNMGVIPTYDLADRHDGYGDGFGGGWFWIIILFAFFGWGGNGFGFGNRGNGIADNTITNEFLYTNLNSAISNGFQSVAQSEQATRDLIGQTARQMDNGLCQLGYQGLQNTNILERQLCDNRFATQMGFQTLGSQLASCCCDLKSMNLENRYIGAQQTCDIIQAGDRNTQRIIDYLTNEKIEGLRTELQSAQLALQNNAQTQTLVDTLRPCPIPAYLSCSPYAAYNFNGYNGGGCGYGCGGLV